jgi:mannose-6-phosphate isomerase-like protein (cupin superfamily)
MVGPDPGAAEPVGMVDPGAADARPGSWRRLVAGTGSDGRSHVVADGAAPVVYEPAGPGGVSLVELWQTGGLLRTPEAGGDPPGAWELEPRNRGVAYRAIAMPPGFGADGSGWHTTDTIDVDIVISGRIEMAVPGSEPVVLGPGDAVVQRATEHRWAVVGDEPVRYVVVMAALRRD